jgi:hypothetical protein
MLKIVLPPSTKKYLLSLFLLPVKTPSISFNEHALHILLILTTTEGHEGRIASEIAPQV